MTHVPEMEVWIKFLMVTIIILANKPSMASHLISSLVEDLRVAFVYANDQKNVFFVPRTDILYA